MTCAYFTSLPRCRTPQLPESCWKTLTPTLPTDSITAIWTINVRPTNIRTVNPAVLSPTPPADIRTRVSLQWTSTPHRWKLPPCWSLALLTSLPTATCSRVPRCWAPSKSTLLWWRSWWAVSYLATRASPAAWWGASSPPAPRALITTWASSSTSRPTLRRPPTWTTPPGSFGTSWPIRPPPQMAAAPPRPAPQGAARLKTRSAWAEKPMDRADAWRLQQGQFPLVFLCSLAPVDLPLVLPSLPLLAFYDAI